MFGSLTCRNGHSWVPGPTPPGEDCCLICGAGPRSPYATRPAVWVVLGLVEMNLLAATVCCFARWDRLGALAPLALAVALAGLGAWLYAQAGRARRMEEVCRAMGLTFTGQLSPGRLKALGPFQVFTENHALTAYHLMEGAYQGHTVALLELRDSGDTDVDAARALSTVVIVAGLPPRAGPPGPDFARHFRPRRRAAGAIQRPGAGEECGPPPPLPDLSVEGLAFRLEPLGPGGWLWQRLGWYDTPFPGHPGFSECYRVRGPCTEAVRRAFRPEVLDFFAEHPDWHVEAVGGRLLAHRKGPCVPEDCPGLIAEVVQMYRVLLQAWSAAQKG